MKWLFIEANDVWMFRESRPFAAGQAFIARSVFPPYPQTMAGAIRTNILEQAGVSFEDYRRRRVNPALLAAVGAPANENQAAEIGSFRLLGPFLASRTGSSVKRFVRPPLDLMKRESDGHMQLGIATPAPQVGFETNLPFENWRPLNAPSKDRGWKEVDGWLDEDGLSAYLKGKAPSKVTDSPELFLTEEKIGLGIDYNVRTAKESLLYHAEFVRPLHTENQESGLVVGIDDQSFRLLPPNVLMLGGEGRSAYYEAITVPASIPDPKPGKIKVILTTPAFFEHGWQPNTWSHWLGHNASLISAAVGKAITISGWDLARGQAKPMCAFVPPGSVYYFENATPCTQPFTQTPEGEPDFGALGFGGFVQTNW